MESRYLDAIKRANRLGAQGHMVLEAVESTEADGNDKITLLACTPPAYPGSGKPWYEQES